MSAREDAIERAEAYVDRGGLMVDLSALVALPTESQNPQRAGVLTTYLDEGLTPRFERLGFSCRKVVDPATSAHFLYAERLEDPRLPTILGYGHGDVVHGMDEVWTSGTSPWVLTEKDGMWYGRGVADNKGQHAINLGALESVLELRGSLGFNAKYLIEMGEEVGSPGLRQICTDHRELLSADALIASDGPRLNAERPTLFLGTRGVATFDLTIHAHDRAYHSGNWGGLLSDPAIQLAHAIASIVSSTGEIRIKEWVPAAIPASVRDALADLPVETIPGGPCIDAGWGQPGLSAAEQLFGWSSFDVLAFQSGQPGSPVNAVPPSAWARCQLRFVVGVDLDAIIPALRRHLDSCGFDFVEVAEVEKGTAATRLDPDDPWVRWVGESIARTSGSRPAILPNLGGTLPNDIFADVLGLRTIWIPHSYPDCNQHAPDEHLPISLIHQAIGLMAAIYWDLGTSPPKLPS